MHSLGTYLVNGLAGNENVAGAPMLHFSLVVVSGTGKVSGHAMITQAIAPPNNEKIINNITGQVHATGLGPVTKIVTLKGSYLDYLPPPAIGVVDVPFECHLAIDDAWNGRGGFKCGWTQAENVPVRTVPR